MSETEQALNSLQGTTTGMVGLMTLGINSTVLAIKTTLKVTQELAKAIFAIHLKLESKKELSGGERTMLKMLQSGSSLSCVTMTKADSELLKKHSKEYSVQYHCLDTYKAEDNDKDYCTVFVRTADYARFDQFCKDYNIGVTKHGEITGEPQKPFDKDSVAKVLSDPEQMKNFTHDNVFDVKKFYDEHCKRGGAVEEFPSILDEIIKVLMEKKMEIDMTGFTKDYQLDLDVNFTKPLSPEAAKEQEITENSLQAATANQKAPEQEQLQNQLSESPEESQDIQQESPDSKAEDVFGEILSSSKDIEPITDEVSGEGGKNYFAAGQALIQESKVETELEEVTKQVGSELPEIGDHS